jgi:hypothetical protein
MKKLNISEKHLSFIFISSLVFLIGTSLVSIIGHRLGVLAVNDSFDNFKNHTLMYVILPLMLTIKLLQWIGVLPQSRNMGETYTKEAYPRAYNVMRYGKMAVGIVVLVLVLMLITDKLIQN